MTLWKLSINGTANSLSNTGPTHALVSFYCIFVVSTICQVPMWNMDLKFPSRFPSLLPEDLCLSDGFALLRWLVSPQWWKDQRSDMKTLKLGLEKWKSSHAPPGLIVLFLPSSPSCPCPISWRTDTKSAKSCSLVFTWVTLLPEGTFVLNRTLFQFIFVLLIYLQRLCQFIDF